jgi:hypothetical protein
VPPEAATAAEYAAPTVPPGRELVVIATGGTMVTVNVFDAVARFVSDAWMVTL